ncbi:MAG: SMI1/KNR4 family protein [Polyangiales bacterium]
MGDSPTVPAANIQSILQRLRFRSSHVERSAVFEVLRQLPRKPPYDYVRFLYTYGGGNFDIELVVRCSTPPPISSDGACGFDEFLSPGDGVGSLNARLGRQAADDRLIPIASAPSDDLYCLRWSEREGWDVVFWDHDSGLSYSAASSFEDLVERLEVVPEAPEVSGDVTRRIDPDLL